MSVTTVIYSLIGVDGASPAFEAAGASADELDGKFGKLGKAAQLMGIAIAAGAAVVAVESVKSAVAFQASMEKIHTQAGASQASVESLTKSVLKLAPSTEQGPEQLADALYHLKSLGMDNATAMKALATTSNLAAVGGSNLEDTATAIGAAWRSGIKGGQSFNQVAATVNATIGAGNMTMTAYVDSLSSGILPSARTFGVSLKSVGAALALMTDEGVPATDAATRLRMTLSLIGGPSAAAQKQLAKIGLSGTALATAMRGPQGIIGAVQLLKTHLDDSGLSAVQSAALLTAAFGGGKSSSTIMTLLNNLSTLKKKQDQINTSMGAYGGAVTAQRKTASAQFDLLKSTVDTLGIRLGLDLLPPVTQFAGYLNKTVLPAVEKFAGWLASPDVRPWTEIAGKLTLAAAAATAIYSGLKKASEITGISKLLEAKKTAAPSAATTAAANMGAAGDTMYKASLNMLKSAGMTEDATVGGAVTPSEETAVGVSVAGWLKSAAGGVFIALIAGNIAGMIAQAAHPATKQEVRQYQKAVPGPVQAVSNTLFGGPSNTASLLEPAWSLGAPRALGASPKGAGAEPAPGSAAYTAYQAQLQSSQSGPAERVWSTAYEDFQRNFAGRVTSWFTKSLPSAFTHGIPARIWSPAYQGFQRDFAGKVTSWFTRSLPHFFTESVPDKVWSPAYQGFQRDFAGKVTSWFTGSLPHFFTKTIPGKIWSPAYQDFQRDFAGKLTSWFTVSLPHFFTAGGSEGAHDFASGFDSGKHWVLSEVDKAKGWVTGEFAKAGSWLLSAGASIVSGLVSGIESKAESPVSALVNVGSSLVSHFKSGLHIKSPSQVFYQLGTMITAGLSAGISETAGAAETAAAKLAAKVTAAYQAGQITSSEENSLLGRITTALASRDGKVGKTLQTISLEMQAGLLSSLENAASAAAAKTAVGKLIGYVKTAWSAGAISTSKASSLTSWLEKDNSKLQSLAAKRQSIAATIKTAVSFANSTTSSTESFASLSSVLSGSTATSAGILGGLQADLASISQFNAAVKKLAKLGLRKDLLNQIIQMGPGDGLTVANALLDGPVSTIQQVNATQAAINTASSSLGQTAANAMYDTGAAAGKGFLSGLEAQQKSITKLMQSIAASMVTTLKKELGIHSPSKVTYGIGEFTGIGIEQGLLSRVRHVEGAASRLAVAAVPGPGQQAGSPAQAPAAAAQGGAFTGNLYLDSGELLGVVKGEIRRHDQKLLNAANAGTGLNG